MRPLTEEQQKFINTYCGFKGRDWIAAKLGIAPSTVTKYVRLLGRQMGVRVGYVKLIDALVDGGVSRTASYAAKADGVLRQADCKRAPYTVPEKWLDEYLDRQLDWSEAQDTASTEGWWTVHDIAAVMGVPWRVASGKLTKRKRGEVIGQFFADVPRMVGPRRIIYYEPEAARVAAERARQHTLKLKARTDYATAAMSVMQPGQGLSMSSRDLIRRVVEASGRVYSPKRRGAVLWALEHSPYFEKSLVDGVRVMTLKEWRARAA